MGGGAPLAFLNKKTWHPGSFRNTEEVWKREQAAAAEARKAEEIRKQIEDERKRDELSEIAAKAGIKRTERLDWMYGGAMASRTEAQARLDTQQQQQQQQQAQPLSKGAAPDEHLSRAERAAMLPSFYQTETPASQNEQWARLNNDPLLLIKRQEQQSIQRIKQNPVKMQEILKEVEKLKKGKDSKHKKDKKHKTDKHHKKDRSKRDHRPSDSDSSGSEGHWGTLHGHKRGSAAAHLVDHHHQQQQRQEAGSPRKRSRHEGYERGSSMHHRDRSPPPASRQVAAAPGGGGSSRQEVPRRRSRSRSRSRDRLPDRSWYPREGSRERGQQPRPGHYSREDAAQGNRQDYSSSRGRGSSRERHADRDRDRDRQEQRHHSNGRHDSGSREAAGAAHNGREHSPGGERHPPRPTATIGGGGSGRPAAAAGEGPRGRTGYGLSVNEAAAEHLAAVAAERAAATRQLLEEGARRREEEAQAKAAQRHVRKDYQTGRLTEEEKAARLAEMMGNAKQHEQQREARLRAAHAAEAAEAAGRGVSALLAKAAAGGTAAGDAFRGAAMSEVYGKLGEGGVSLEARVSSRRHYAERGAGRGE